MSESAKIKVFTEEHRSKMSKSRIGLKHSEETKEKMSVKQLGDKNHRFGKIMEQETRNKISISSLGKLKSEETKVKMSENNGKNRPVMVNGKVYRSITKASNYINCSVSYICNVLKGINKLNKIIWQAEYIEVSQC